jgi:serine/threonine protein kinase
LTSPKHDPRAAAEARVGSSLDGKWHLDRLLDVGGMGAVFAATHRNGRQAAIKVLHPEYAGHVEIRKRFLREGYVANKLDHPGAVAILDDDVDSTGAPFLVMELLRGESLSGWLSRVGGRLGPAEVLAIAGQLLEVLEVAHANGIVHRDIKPANVFVTAVGHVKLLDFGLARIRDATISLIPTGQGIVMGTLGYMAPEQARGIPEHIDTRADIFGVGAVMFRALAGERIHEKDTPFDMTISAMRDPAPSLATKRPDADGELIRVVDRALAFQKDARWQTARAMFDALHGVYRGLTAGKPRAVPPPLPLPAKRAAPPPSAQSVDVPISVEDPSLVIDVAFGEEHDAAMERERKRTREVIEGLSKIDVAIDPQAMKGGGES